MTTPYLAKAFYRDRTNLGSFIDQYGFGKGKVFFMTVTFKNNVDKKDCAASFNVFRSYLCKSSIRASHAIPVDPPFHYISVWEEHKKGGWHLHILGHIEGVSTSRLRDLIRSFLHATSSNVGYINVKWTFGHDTNGIKFYMSKYLMKATRQVGVRYVNYSRSWMRIVTLPFCWLNGASAMWRKACRELDLNFPHSFKIFYRHCGFRSRQSLIDCWSKGDVFGAILTLKRWGWGVYTRDFEYDFSRFVEFGLATGGVMTSTDDYPVADFLTFKPSINGFVYGRPIEDSDCIMGGAF